MPSNRYLTLANLVCASCVLVLDIVNLFLQHVHPWPPIVDLYDDFLVFDGPLLLLAVVFVLCLILYYFAQKQTWQVLLGLFFEIVHLGMSVWDASRFGCLHVPSRNYSNCFGIRTLVISLFNILFLASGVLSQSLSLYRQRRMQLNRAMDEELVRVYDDK